MRTVLTDDKFTSGNYYTHKESRCMLSKNLCQVFNLFKVSKISTKFLTRKEPVSSYLWFKTKLL